MSASSFQLTAVHEWCAHDPFGKLKPADVSAALLSVTDNSGTVRLRAARNGYVSFRILIQGTGEYRLNASIGKNLETDLFKAWYHRMADQKEKQPDYWPDALIPVHGTEANGAIPDPDNKINGQSVQEYWVDLFVPPDAKPGTITGKIELITGGQTIKLPVAVEVLAMDIPENPCVTVYLKSYGWEKLREQYPSTFARTGKGARMWKNVIGLFHNYHRLIHEHRAIFRSRGGSHSGSFDIIYSPRVVGNGRQKHLEDWEMFDQHFGPLFDGSVFLKAAPGAPRPRRPALPVQGMYAPIGPNWPASYLWWGQPGYEVEFTNCVAELDAHLRAKGWTRTQMEMFFFHKKRFRGFEWDGDETKFAKDDDRFLEMGQLLKKATANSPVKWVFRADSSWQQKFQFERLANVVTFWVLGGFWRWYPQEIRQIIARGDTVWWYGGTPQIQWISNQVLESLYTTWACGLHGYNHWLATDPGKDPWFACNGAGTGMVYPGERFGLAGPIPSTRMKIMRNGIQDIDLLDQAVRASGRIDAVREELARAIPLQLWSKPPRAALELPPEEWDSRKLGAEHEPNAIEQKTADPSWWMEIRQRAIPEEVR